MINLNNESYKIISEKFFLLINTFLPGIVVLEIIFKKGLFSNQPQTIFEFILFLFWAILLSIPFYFLIGLNTREYILGALKENNLSTKNIDNEKLEVLDFNFQFIYILNSTLLFYIIDRIFHKYFYFIEIFGISPKFMELFSVFTLTAMISIILSIPLTFLFIKIINKKFLKIINLIKKD